MVEFSTTTKRERERQQRAQDREASVVGKSHANGVTHRQSVQLCVVAFTRDKRRRAQRNGVCANAFAIVGGCCVYAGQKNPHKWLVVGGESVAQRVDLGKSESWLVFVSFPAFWATKWSKLIEENELVSSSQMVPLEHLLLC